MGRGLLSFRLVQVPLGRGGIFASLPIFASMIGLSTSLIEILITFDFMPWILLTPLGGLGADGFNRRTLTIGGNIFIAYCRW